MSKDTWMYFSFIHTSDLKGKETKEIVSSKYRVEAESIKSNDNDIIN